MRLDVGIFDWPHQSRFFQGRVDIPGAELDVRERPEDVPYAEFAASLSDFDVCEIPLGNYLAGKELGLPFTALPVFPTRRFIQWMIELPEGSAVQGPKDLEGKRVASTYFGNTDAVWARGILEESYDVDWSDVTWVTTKAERFDGARKPANVEVIEGSTSDDLLRNGLADAKFGNGYGREPGAGIKRLWEDPEQEAAAWFDDAHYFPILHTVIVKDELVRDHPDLVRAVYDELLASKQSALEEYAYGDALPENLQFVAQRTGFPGSRWHGATREFLGRDPLVYGLEATRPVLEKLIGFAYSQEALHQRSVVDDVFLTFD